MKSINLLLIVYYFMNGSCLSNSELSDMFDISPRSITRYIIDINIFFMDNFINHQIVYDRSLKKYIWK